MPRVIHVKHAMKEYECNKCGDTIAKGQPYVHWSFRYGGKRFRCSKSECQPRPSDLTQSAFLSQLYDLEDQVANFGWPNPETSSPQELAESENPLDSITSQVEDMVSTRDGIADDIDALAEECEDNFNNMPENFQMGSTGEQLQARADSCHEWAEELRNVDSPNQEDFEGENAEEQYREAVDNWISDVQAVCYGGDY